jgi:L-aspartate oxidase
LADNAPTAPRAGVLPPALNRRFLLEFDADSCAVHACDLLVVGSGIAGLTAALAAAKTRSVALVTKASLTETNTWYAQGGIAGAVGEADSVELHLADTLVVGQGLCDEAVVRAVVGEAPEALSALREYGVRFDLAEGGEVALAREGGHSLPRVLHSGDATGAAIQRALTDAALASEQVAVFERRFLVDLLTEDGRCVGAIVLDTATGAREVFRAGAVVLATGGAGQAYRVTTNPAVATGDGLAAAWRAGALVTDMEFVQFHPTALDHDSAPRFLITEALRGEGAYLLDCNEQRFMLGKHPLAELAPRDVVSREIEAVMARCGRANVWLDARHLGEEYLRTRFPTIWEACAEAGYNLSRDLVPVAPAAHYLVGGVLVDVDGRTSVPGLYASGEVAASGLHGANRLASNSLLEGLVFSRRIVRALDTEEADPAATGASAVEDPASADVEPAGGASGCDDAVGLSTTAAAASLRETMQRGLGMSRVDAGVAAAISNLEVLAAGIVPADDVASMELANLLTVGTLIAHAARIRTESRGCHFRRDYPDRDEVWRVRIVQQRDALPFHGAVEGRMMPWSRSLAGPVGEEPSPLAVQPASE